MELDLQLIILLKDIYPEYDGIVSPVNLPNILANAYHHSEMCIFNTDNVKFIKEIPRNQTGGTMFSQEPVRIVGAISLDNEIIRKYTESMKDFHKTFKPLPKHGIIQKQFVPYVLAPPLTETNTSNKNRKTRKIKK
jgi:hypothetical protein